MTPDDAGPPDDPTDPPPTPGAGGPDDGAGHLVGGRYELLRSLGRGGMGVVWAARDITLDRDVAVKEVTLPPGLDGHQRALLRERTLREARAAARIRSEAAVTVYDVVEEDGRPWIVMELLPPRSLADVVREQGPVAPEVAARVGLRLLDALAAAHAAGVLHRDVKPANVLFDAAGTAVLTDFGIASLDGDPSLTTTGTVVGSPGYVAPERALGRPPSPASDLWSLGVTLAAAVHGRSPFEKDTPLATIVAAMQEPLTDAVVTGPLGTVIERLLAKEPADRPGVEETRRLLEAAVAGAGTGAGAGTAGAAATTVLPVLPPDPRATGAAGPADGELTQALPRVPGTRGPRPARQGAAAGGGAGARPPGPPRPRPVAAGDTPARRSRLIPVLLAAVAVVAALMVGLVVLDRRDAPTAAAGDPTTAAAQEPTAQASVAGPAPQEPAASPTAAAPPAEPSTPPDEGGGGAATAAAEPGQAPEGFQLYEDPGYRVAVPQGWTVEQESGSRTTFQDPASRRYLLVEEGGEPAGDPVEDWEQQEKSVSKRLAGYELIGIERAEYREFDSADWQFRWDADAGRLRVLDRAVVDPTINRAYALYWSVPDEEWDASLPVLDAVVGSFQPVG